MLRCGMIGMTGIGTSHLRRLLAEEQKGRLQLAAICDVRNERTETVIDDLVAQGKSFVSDYRQMDATSLDAVFILTPLHLHMEMASHFLQKGVHVFLEKPPVVLLREIDELLRIQAESGKSCQVGFQHAAASSVRALSPRLRSGEFGKLRSITSEGRWVRDDAYYRNSWKGSLTLKGQPVLDGSVMNPLAHLLNMSVYFAEESHWGKPVSVRSELYRGHDYIESEDTCSARFTYANGGTLALYTTLCANENQTPTIRLVFEDAEVLWSYNSYLILRKGSAMEGPIPCDNGQTHIAENFLRHLEGKEELVMSLERSRSYLMAANAIFAASNGISTVPAEWIRSEQKRGGTGITSTIYGIDEIIHACMPRQLTFSEAGVPWARPSSEFRLERLDSEWRQWGALAVKA